MALIKNKNQTSADDVTFHVEKRQPAAPATPAAQTAQEQAPAVNVAAAPQTGPSVYGGAYDSQILDLYGQLSSRPDFNYNVNEDMLYQTYKDRYTQNAKRSMKDTMGQAAGLTGGYGSTYSQGVGQQAYDETMRGLTDKIPELEERAYNRYQAEGQGILDRFNLSNQLGAADQATRQHQQEWDFQQQQYSDAQAQQAYSNLSAAILQSGYQPTESELAASGMTQQQADALRQAWIAAYPGLAYMQGVITSSEYLKLTGKAAPGTGGGGGGYGGGGSRKKEDAPYTRQDVTDAYNAGFSFDDIYNQINTNAGSAENRQDLLQWLRYENQ